MSAGAPISITRDALLARLAEQHQVAEVYDRQQLAEHRKAEQAFLAAFRAACREAVKWDYATAKTNQFTPMGQRSWRDEPSCPISQAKRIASLTQAISVGTQARFVVHPNTLLYMALVWDPDADDTDRLC